MGNSIDANNDVDKAHWVDGPWPGNLAPAARPRSGEWLKEEIASWANSGADTVLSLLTYDETRDLTA